MRLACEYCHTEERVSLRTCCPDPAWEPVALCSDCWADILEPYRVARKEP